MRNQPISQRGPKAWGWALVGLASSGLAAAAAATAPAASSAHAATLADAAASAPQLPLAESARESAKDNPQTRSRQPLQLARSEDNSLLAGLGFSLLEDVDFRVGLGSRLKPYARARYGTTWQLAPTQAVDLRETVFWTPDDRLGSTTVGSYLMQWSPEVTLRWVNALTVTQAARVYEWSSSLGGERAFGGQRVLGLELLMNGRVAPSAPDASDRGVLMRWEQPVYKNWLLGEVVAGHFWPRGPTDTQRGKAWAVGVGLKMHF